MVKIDIGGQHTYWSILTGALVAGSYIMAQQENLLRSPLLLLSSENGESSSFPPLVENPPFVENSPKEELRFRERYSRDMVVGQVERGFDCQFQKVQCKENM